MVQQTGSTSDNNKVITFLAMLSAYTEDSQMNIGFIAVSSAGKSYIVIEVADLFPGVKLLGYCSPKAFFHDASIAKYDEKNKCYRIDLERKVVVFLDQPHSELLAKLRPLLSHDKKEITVKITDKNVSQQHNTKNIILRGWPAVVFCSTGTKIDEQESTRMFLLSPQINQKKLKAGIKEKAKKESNKAEYQQWLDKNPERKLLQQRIKAIKAAHITHINISPLNQSRIQNRFLKKYEVLKARHQRDVAHVIALIKTLALLNLWFRDRRGNTIMVNKADIDAAFALWDEISESQKYGLPPYIYELYKRVFMPAFYEKMMKLKASASDEDKALTRQEVCVKHSEVYGDSLSEWSLRQDILPALETAGFIRQAPSVTGVKKALIYNTGECVGKQCGRKKAG